MNIAPKAILSSLNKKIKRVKQNKKIKSKKRCVKYAKPKISIGKFLEENNISVTVSSIMQIIIMISMFFIGLSIMITVLNEINNINNLSNTTSTALSILGGH